MLGATLRNNFV